jgi:hypothetical protein
MPHGLPMLEPSVYEPSAWGCCRAVVLKRHDLPSTSRWSNLRDGRSRWKLMVRLIAGLRRHAGICAALTGANGAFSEAWFGKHAHATWSPTFRPLRTFKEV